MKIRQIATELTARGAVLHVLRNGRPRHIGEIRDRMRDRGWDLEVPHIRHLLRTTLGIVEDGNLAKLGNGKDDVWRFVAKGPAE
jgi:hypothetical protein